MNSDLKVCVLVRWFPPLFGGGGIAAMRRCLELARKGITVSVLTSGTSNLPEQDEIAGIPVFRLPAALRDGRLSELRYDLGLAVRLWRQRHSYDILSMSGLPSFLALPVSKLLGKKTVLEMTLLGSDDPMSVKRMGRTAMLKFAMLRFADAFVSISPALTRAYESSGLPREKLWNIPYGIDTRKFAPVYSESEKLRLRRELGIPVDRLAVTFVGAIVKRKGIDLLIEAWKNVTDKIKPYPVLVAVGPEGGKTGELRHNESFVRAIKNTIDKSGLKDRIIFTGESDRVPDFLRASDVFVFPTRREGFGLVMIEAMACGLPVVMSMIEGISDFIVSNNQDGVIVSAEDPVALAAALSELLMDADKRRVLGRRAREKVLSEFSMERVTNDHIRLYGHLLSKRASHEE